MLIELKIEKGKIFSLFTERLVSIKYFTKRNKEIEGNRIVQ